MPERHNRQHTDHYGDPLPEGAVARLGTVRFRHGTGTFVLALSPNGKLLATGGSNGSGLCLWDAASGRPLHRLRNVDVRALAFSADSKQLFVGPDLTLIDTVTGKVVRRAGIPAFPVRCASFSRDGITVAVTKGPAAVVILDSLTGNPLSQLVGHASAVTAIAFSQDSKLLVTGSLDRTARLWDGASAKEIRQFVGHESDVSAIAISPDAKMLASAGRDGTVRLWDIATGKPLHKLKGHKNIVFSVTFSPDGKTLASGGNDETVRLWDVAAGKQLYRWPAGVVSVRSIAFSPDGRTVASTGLWDHAVRLWDTETGVELHAPSEHTGMVNWVTFSRDGKSLVSWGADRKVLEWDLTGRSVWRALLTDSSGELYALSPDGKLLASAHWTEEENQATVIQLWDTVTGKLLHEHIKVANSILTLVFSPDGKRLASSGRDGAIRLWDVVTGQTVHEWTKDKTFFSSVTFSPDGKTMAAGGNTICLWEVATGKELRRWTTKHARVFHLQFSPRGNLLASSDARGISVWEVDTGEQLGSFGGEGTFRAMGFSPCGRTLAGAESWSEVPPNGEATKSPVLHLWELASGQKIWRRQGDQGSIASLAFAPDGRTLATGGGDSTILLWDLTGRMRNGQLQPGNLTQPELETLWTDLGADASKAYQAVWTLKTVPEKALSLFSQHVRPVPRPSLQRIAQLITDLDSAQFSVREDATRALEDFGELAEPALRAMLQNNPSAEMRQRVMRLLAKAKSPRSRELVRALRAVSILEQMGTAEASELLKALAKGTPESRLTQEAQRALEYARKNSLRSDAD